MKSIAFIDSEIDPKSYKVLDLGSIKSDGSTYHLPSQDKFVDFLKGTEYICGHNIFIHDLKYLGQLLSQAGVFSGNIIDTLYFSPLLFPNKPYHALLKDDKLQSEESNNPLNDAIKAKDLFFDEVNAFGQLNPSLQKIFYSLLRDQTEFQSFFRFVDFENYQYNLSYFIKENFENQICEQTDLAKIIANYPVELAYSLALIHANDRYSITPRWVTKNFPNVEKVIYQLRNSPCLTGCIYCNNSLDAHRGLKKYFGYNSYRTYGGEALQEKAVKAAISNQSILAVFPTGGGKSITFQVPALISGESTKGLTVIISPLQSLMKDQVDNLEKNGITEAVTINGLLDPIERSKSYERVEDGSASLLYISPESLRSKTIERLLLGRKIARFVIDEAHCFSSWGQDFRVDYLYIADFIKNIQEKKNLDIPIPVSCFTATAKQKVIEDIQEYFRQNLSLELQLFTSRASRTNLQYEVYQKDSEEDKYQTLRDLIEIKDCPTIVYVSRTKRARQLAERLSDDGFNARPYHGKMDTQEKTENQNAFISGEVPIMVATSAFGMGVDKKDVGVVIHYDISDSLENYVQEAGRAGRDENIQAECFVLYNEEDLSKHFILLNQTKLSIKEIQQVWKAIKEITRFKQSVSQSALEIARKAGWDDNVAEIETRVTTAIAALEDAGYLKRGQNMPRVFANSILSKNAQEAIDKINASDKLNEKQKENAVRIIRKLFSNKSKKLHPEDESESRIDYISDHLGIVKGEVISLIHILREEKILADNKDLTAYVKRNENINRSLNIVDSYSRIEKFLLPYFEEQEKTFHIKELNEDAESFGIKDVTPNKLKTIINFWAIKNWIKRQGLEYSKNHFVAYCTQEPDLLMQKTESRQDLARFIVEFLYERSALIQPDTSSQKNDTLVEFSVHELKDTFENHIASFGKKVSIEDVEDALFYLSRIDAIKIEGGFLVTYNRLTIERTEQDNLKRYTKDDYQKLNQFYENKVQQIHIVGEYAKKMISDYKEALQFVEDYFQLNYSSFLRKYFPGSKADELRLKMTPAKFRQLFGELSPAQLKIIKDNETKYIVVAAGPGSGKTRVLVHKLAALLLMEDIKHEQLLMVTFSRAAATEFKKRLIKLVGNAAHFVHIRTFHSYCFDLLGKVGTLEKSGNVIQSAVEKIKNRDVENSDITKAVLVIDEAQDMNSDEYALIQALMEYNEEMRVIAVGDDDQNIYEFRGASSKYLEQFIKVNQAVKHELTENYRSKSNLVQFSNQFVQTIQHRLKTTPIIAHQGENGQIRIIQHLSPHLIEPLVQNVKNSPLKGTTCVLTRTNDEALQITGLLIKNGIQAKLIQTNDNFNLFNLLEIRFFLQQFNSRDETYSISDEAWKRAKWALVNTFARSAMLDIAKNIIKDFELTRPQKKYKSDLDTFIRESKLEDFFNENGETIFVSTIHKAKGKEFDNVFLLIDNFQPEKEEDKRSLYVAVTRAKSNLNIHLNSPFPEKYQTENLTLTTDPNTYSAPNEIVIHLSFKDVWLSYFINRQKLISELMSGDELIVENNELLNSKSESILKFSKKFTADIEDLKTKSYHLKSAKVNFIIYWKPEDSEQEIRIVLPELLFVRV